MKNLQKDRRKIIKTLVLAGFGIHFVGCSSSTEPVEKKKEKSPIKKKPEQIVEEIQEEVKNHNVVYLTHEDEQFEELATYFNKFTQKVPAIIALVSNAEGVSEAILHAKELDLPVSVKSGGHSFEQFSSNNGGMVINLSLLNTIEWKDNNEVQIGPACLLKEMYDELLPKNRILPAGSCGTVGVGGLTLGGGYGFFARKYGLTCDNLISATFIDGNGEIHEVSGNHELMWALRGGGNGNFGVVSSFRFKTYPIPEHFSYTRLKAKNLDTERAKLLLDTWFEYGQLLPNSCFSAFVLNGKSLTILITNFEASSPILEEMIEALTALCDSVKSKRNADIAGALKNYYGIQYPIYFKNASAGYYSKFSDIEGCIDKVLEKVVTTPGLIYQVNTLGGAINLKENKLKSSYPHRSYEYLSELQTYWSEGQDQKRDRYLKEFEYIQNLFYENGNRAQYRNYPSIGFKDWETAYFGENYHRLQVIKRKYDRDNTIRHPQSIQSGFEQN
jgi:hypothetical protein